MEAKLTRYDSQNSDTTALRGRELYHLQFSLKAGSPETFGYTLVQHYTAFDHRWSRANDIMIWTPLSKPWEETQSVSGNRAQ
jgi:hypothetical protein